ncbi:MAG: hypothetical protein QNJ98_09655 [Planctomycetota bacterium]|nr:hypothetical protein [Planctomycetota bacterium]
MRKRLALVACVCAFGLAAGLTAEAWTWGPHASTAVAFDLTGDLTGANGYIWSDDLEGSVYGEYGCAHACYSSIGPVAVDTWEHDQSNFVLAGWSDFLDNEGARTFDAGIAYFQEWYAVAVPQGPVHFSVMYVTRIDNVELVVDGVEIEDTWLGQNTNNVATLNTNHELEIGGENGSGEDPVGAWLSQAINVAEGGHVQVSANVRTIIDYGLTHDANEWSMITTHGESVIGVFVLLQESE